jgi:hypothetical protein
MMYDRIYALHTLEACDARSVLGPRPLTRKLGLGRARSSDPWSAASASVAAVAFLVAAERAEEVEFAERGPVDVGEVELAVGALPEEEAAEAYLAACADDQVGVGLADGVEVRCERFGGDLLGDLVGGGAVGGESADEGASAASKPPEVIASQTSQRRAGGTPGANVENSSA